MRHGICELAIAMFLLSTSSELHGAAAQAEPSVVDKVVVAQLSGLGVAPEVMHRLEDYLRGEISRLPGYEVVSRTEQENTLARDQRQDWAYTRGEPRLMRRLAKVFGARYALQGTVAALGESIRFTVKMFDTRAPAKTAMREQSGNLEGGGHKMIPGIRLLAHQLFAPQLITGYLKIDVPLEGVLVLLDGSTLGITPLAEPLEIPPGKHEILLRRGGYEDIRSDVVAHPFQVTVIKTSLTKSK